MDVMPPRILVLGGDGYIGRSFVRLQRTFREMRIVSRTPSFRNSAETVLTDFNQLIEQRFNGVDLVFNALGLAHGRHSGDRALLYRVNRDLPVLLALKAKEQGVAKFVHMSSMAVYGDAERVGPESGLNPRTDYARSKAEADDKLLGLAEGGFEVLLVRPPMVYGPGSPGNMTRLARLVRHLPVLPFADATRPREFLCVQNLVRLLEYAMWKERNGVLLLKDTRTFSTRELVEIMLDAMQIRKPITPFPLMNVFRRLLPAYHAKLFAGLVIEGAVTFPAAPPTALDDPEQALREMTLGMFPVP